MPDNATRESPQTAAPKPTTDVVRAAWDAIGRHLTQRREKIDREIRAYPPPIPACDQQYNHLLDQRARVGREWSQFERAVSASLVAQDPVASVEQFLQSCGCIDVDTAERVRALLTRGR